MPQITLNIYMAIKSLIIKNRRLFVSLFYLLQAAIANYLAFVLKFESLLFSDYLSQMVSYLPLILLIRFILYLSAGLYRDLWRYASVSDLIKIAWSATAGSIVFVILVRYVALDTAYPRSIYILDWLLFIIISGGIRLFIRILREYLNSEPSGKKTLIIGAGDGGEMIVRDMKNNPTYAYKPIGFIDTDPYKIGHSIHGIPILGSNRMAGEIIKKYKPEEILIAIPSAGHKTIRDIYETYKPFNIPIKTLPKLSDVLDGKVSVSHIRLLSLEDLLQREPIRTNIEHVREYIEGKSVMVTGAGGSIGSELCRQIIEYGPSRLVMLDRYENTLHEVDLELRRKKPRALIYTLVGDVQDTKRLEHVFGEHKPQIIFHAAAHKHVPLMEHSPIEAVKNNIFGTKNLIDASIRHGSESFVLISTDKAVNPTSIMGATKRIAEFIALGINGSSGVKFTVVRFGNVLGSNGSVIHLFKEQIKAGGPVTVTHPQMKRFFMLIPEASQLVLTASAVGRGGEIFVLDMGEQIKILDLAENMIRLSGFVPHADIKIEFIGIRPGEKLHEELFDETEEIRKTPYDKLNMAVPNSMPSASDIDLYLNAFGHVVDDNCHDCLVPTLKLAIPSFRTSITDAPIPNR